MNKLLPFLVISLFFLGLIPIGSSTVTVYTGQYYYVGNETYGVTQTMNFSYIEHNSNWIRFNDTYFNVTSANPIYINLSFLHEDISMAANNTLLLQFNASTTGGTVWFNISGFVPTSQYYYKNASGIGNSINADVDGIISFNHSSWSEVLFEVYASYPPGDPSGYINITQPPINATVSPTFIEVMGNFDVGNYTTNTSVDIYAPVGWSVSFVNMSFLTAAGAIDQNVTATTYSQYNASYRHYNYTYNPSNTLLDADMGNFSVNVSVIAYNLTHQYNNFTLFSDVFEVYRLNNPYNITALYNQTYHGLNFTWSGGGNVTYLVLHPEGDAGPNDWDDHSPPVPLGQDHYTYLDEVIQDTSDYIACSYTALRYEMYDIENHTSETSHIVNVSVTYCAKCNIYDNQLIPRIKSGSTTDDHTPFNLNTVWNNYTSIWYTDPNTGSNWTWSAIDDLEVGMGAQKIGTSRPYVSHIYVTVRTSGSIAAQTVAVRNNNSFPVDPWNGYTIYNNTGNSCGNHPISDITYFTFYSYNDTTGSFSPGVQVNWGTLGFNCFNESNMSQAIGFDILVTNSDATETYTTTDITNTHFINLDDIPYGDDTIFVISNSSYRQRVYYYDLVANQFYNYTFYLPPITNPVDPGSGDDGGNTTATQLYFVQVIDEANNAIPDVDVTVKRYDSTEDSYEIMGSMVTGGYGYTSIYLVPNTLYKVVANKSGYVERIDDWLTDPVYYGLSYPNVIQLELEEEEYVNETTFNEVITFEAYMNSTGTIFVNYSDSLEETISTNICIYENITLDVFHWDNQTGNDSFQVSVSGANTTRSYQVVLFVNHTTFGEHTLIIFIIGEDIPDRTITTTTRFNTLFNANYGTSPGGFGWSNFFGFFIMLAGVFSLGQRDAGVSMLITGGLLLFVNSIIGLSVIGTIIPILFIVLGILVQWRNHRKEAAG